MPRMPVCRKPRIALCPYAAWRDQDPPALRPAGVAKHGFDSYGAQRYRCKDCGATFLEPHHTAGTLPTFREYMRLEAAAASAVHQEPHHVIAARLGIERKTAARYARPVHTDFDNWTYDGRLVDGAPIRQVGVAEGRYARRTGDMENAPYVVGATDAHRHQKATLGEIEFWLDREHGVGVTRAEKRAWRDVVWNPHASWRERETAVIGARDRLVLAVPAAAQREARN